MQKKNLQNILKQSGFSALIALIIFGPITGVILNNYSYHATLIRPLLLTSLVFIGRSLFLLTYTTIKIPKPFFSGDLINLSKIKLSNSLIKKISLFFIIFLPLLTNNYWLSLLILALIYILLSLGLNIVVGMAGLLDLGFVAFYAIGAYTLALGYAHLGLGFWIMLPLAALLAAFFGIILGFPILKMHGDYLAIVTLGFGEIIFLVLNNWLSLTGGPNGITSPMPTFFGLEFSKHSLQHGIPFHEFFHLQYSRSYFYIYVYWLLILAVYIIIKAVTRLQKMPIGRAWEALREDEIACKSLGINHVTTKLTAFACGAFIGGIGGVFFASYQGFINPSSFTFIESALILAIVVLGGLGSIPGIIIAALILTLLPEVLRNFANLRMLIFGSLMILMMIWRPSGFIKQKRQIFN